MQYVGKVWARKGHRVRRYMYAPDKWCPMEKWTDRQTDHYRSPTEGTLISIYLLIWQQTFRIWLYTLKILLMSILKSKALDIIIFVHTVYRIIFSSCNFLPFTLENSFAPSCIRLDSFFKREIVRGIGIRPVLNSSADNEGKKGENKTGQIFPCIP